ncbi:MAG TPA: YdcF family protein [Patescibacteria group bacterium]|nr:YdcF family protein [Patescibacteria group bacterium]
MSNAAILALGKNWELPIPQDPANIQLSIESEITAEAAGILFTNGIGDLIIFSGGHTAGSNYPSEASKMAESMYLHFTTSDVPVDKIVLEEDSHDTLGNLENVKECIPELDIDEIILVTVGYHLPRTKRLARIAGLPVRKAFKSDYIVGDKQGGVNHLYAREVLARSIGNHSLKPLLRASVSYGIEAAGWGISFVDPKGTNIARLATKTSRHQYE